MRKTFTEIQFTDALQALGATAIASDTYRLLGTEITLKQNHVFVKHLNEDGSWSSSAPVRFSDIIALPMEDEIYGKCFIRSYGKDSKRVSYIW